MISVVDIIITKSLKELESSNCSIKVYQMKQTILTMSILFLFSSPASVLAVDQAVEETAVSEQEEAVLEQEAVVSEQEAVVLETVTIVSDTETATAEN